VDAATTFAVVQDVPASWDTYRHALASLGEAVPEGLVMHIAGPTDEGFRLIDLWQSQHAWERFRDHRLPALLKDAPPAQPIHPTIRDLAVKHLFIA
jgi:hypothetical protein